MRPIVLWCVLAAAGAPLHASAAPKPGGKVSVAVMDLQVSATIPADLARTLTGALSQELDRLGAFRVISSQEIRQMLGFEQQKTMLGCADASCLAQLGGALGTDYLVFGSVALLEGTYLTQLQLVRTSAARVEARVSRNHAGGAAGLVKDVGVAAQLLVRELLDRRSGRLVLSASEEGATVRLDGSVIGSTPLPPAKVPGGVHTLELEKSGFVRFRQDVTVESGADVRVQAVLVPSVEFREQYRARASRTRTLAWAALAVGAAGLAGGGALYAVSSSRARDLNADVAAYNAASLRTSAQADALSGRREDIARLNSFAVGSAVVGVAALATGIVLYRSGDDPARYDRLGPPPKASLEVVPLPLGAAVLARY